MSKYLDLDDCADGNPEAIKELAQLRSQLARAWEVINAYGQYHDGEYDEIPEQRAGIEWLHDYENDHPQEADLHSQLASAKQAVEEARQILKHIKYMTEPVGLDYRNIDTWLSAHPEGEGGENDNRSIGTFFR